MEESSNFEIDEVLELKNEPKVDMIFDSNTAAWEFYATYAKAMGFGVTVLNSKKKEGVKFWVSYGCHKAKLPKQAVDPSTSQPTTKTNCKATMKISKQVDGKWKVNSVHLEHNHVLDPEKSKYLRCYRKIPLHVQREIELNREAGIKMNQTINSLEQRAGDNHSQTYMQKDARNHVDKVRRHELKGGDAQAMLQYFQKMQDDNKDFFYRIDLDEEGRLTKVFWADARSRKAYKEFGDVVTFDTTYLVNRFDMPFAPFVGVNHHGQSMLFGCGLVTHEDTDSFVWLFEAWLACMINNHPQAIITDQDRAMQNAIKNVFPNTIHRWCLWHIMKKIPEKFKGCLDYEQIQCSVSCVVYDSLTPEDFEENWANFIEDYKLMDHDWLNLMYIESSRWVPAFVNGTFWAGMSTTQRSESINSFFDGYVHHKTTLKEFADQYENALRSRVEKEEEEDARSMNSQYRNVSPSKFEKKFQDTYTLAKYKEFRKQISDWHGCEMVVEPVVDGVEHFSVEHVFEVGTVEKYSKTVMFTVCFDEKTGKTNCICQMFESKGMPCAHMLRIWKWKKLSTVPDCYILNRWRKDIVRSHTKVRLSYTNLQKKPEWSRFDDLRTLFNELADRVILSDSRTSWLKGILAHAIETDKEQCSTNITSGTPLSINAQAESRFIVRDPSQGTKKGAPRKKRFLSQFEIAAKKNTIANNKKA